MEISFASNKVEKLLATEHARIRSFGEPAAKAIYRRLVQLQAAPDLGVVASLPGNCHELIGDRAGQLALDVTKGLRLVFVPAQTPPPLKPDGGLDWNSVTAIIILEVTDYHG